MSVLAEAPCALSYELLLRNSSGACSAGDDLVAAVNVADGASTTTGEPVSPSESAFDSFSVCSIPTRKELQLLRNVQAHGPYPDERMAALLKQVRDLSSSAFDEDCLQDVTKKSGFKLSLLVSEDLATLCGFIVAKVAKGSLSIAKLAVPEGFRRHGFGKFIMEELMKAAKKQGDIYDVCLSSLPEAVSFYQRLGFKADRGMKLGPQEDLVEGQVYMEKKLRPRRK